MLITRIIIAIFFWSTCNYYIYNEFIDNVLFVCDLDKGSKSERCNIQRDSGNITDKGSH